MALPKIQEYTKNVIKSIAYAGGDTAKNLMPATAEFYDTNKEVFKTAYVAVRNYRQTINRVADAFTKSNVYQAADTALRNAMDDLKTGKFYNKEREDAFQNAQMESSFGGDDYGIPGGESSSGGGDLDLDSGLDDIDKLLGEGGEGEEDFGLGDAGVTPGDMVVAKSVKKSSMDAASVIANTQIKTTEIGLKNSRVNTSILYGQNQQMLATMQGGFGTLSENTAKLIEFNTSAFKTHIDNSTKFYEENTKLNQERNAMLKEMVEMQRALYKLQMGEEENKDQKKKLRFGDITTSTGAPDLETYFEAIKGNAEDLFNEYGGGMLSAMKGLGGDNPLLMFAQSPLSFIATMLTTTALGTATQKAAESLDKTMAGIFGSIISKFNHYKDDDEAGPLQFLGKIFGIRDSVKSSLDTGEYKRGNMPWNGDANRALVEVIPTLLANIDSGINGTPHKLFDYKTGRWIESRNLRQQYADIRERYATRGTGDLFREIAKGYGSFYRGSLEENEQAWDDLRKVQLAGFQDPEVIKQLIVAAANPSKENEDIITDKAYEFGLSDSKNLENIVDILREITRKGNRKGRDVIKSFASDVLNARDQMDREIRGMQEDPHNIYKALFTNQYIERTYKDIRGEEVVTNKDSLLNKLSLYNQKDDYKKTVFDYLKDIWGELVNIRAFGAGIGGQTYGSIFRRGAYRRAKEQAAAIVNEHNRKLENVKTETVQERRQRRRDEANQRYLDDIKRDRERREKEGSKYKGPHFELTNIEGFTDEDEAAQRANFRARLYDIYKTSSEKSKKADEEDKNWLQERISDFTDYNKEKYQKEWKDIEEHGFLDALLKADSVSKKIGVFRLGLEKLAEKPSAYLTKVLESADEKLYSFFFEEEEKTDPKTGEKVTGFFGRMRLEMTETFQKINSAIDEHLIKPLKEKLGIEGPWDVVRRIGDFFGIDADAAKDSLKEQAGDFFGRIWGSVKDTFSEQFEDARRELQEANQQMKDLTGMNNEEEEGSNGSQGDAGSNGPKPPTNRPKIVGDIQKKIDLINAGNYSDEVKKRMIERLNLAHQDALSFNNHYLTDHVYGRELLYNRLKRTKLGDKNSGFMQGSNLMDRKFLIRSNPEDLSDEELARRDSEWGNIGDVDKDAATRKLKYMLRNNMGEDIIDTTDEALVKFKQQNPDLVFDIISGQIRYFLLHQVGIRDGKIVKGIIEELKTQYSHNGQDIKAVLDVNNLRKAIKSYKDSRKEAGDSIALRDLNDSKASNKLRNRVGTLFSDDFFTNDEIKDGGKLLGTRQRDPNREIQYPAKGPSMDFTPVTDKLTALKNAITGEGPHVSEDSSVNGLLKAIRNALSDLKNSISNLGGSGAPLPTAATGAIFTKGGLTQVSKDEVILPRYALDKNLDPESSVASDERKEKARNRNFANDYAKSMKGAEMDMSKHMAQTKSVNIDPNRLAVDIYKSIPIKAAGSAAVAELSPDFTDLVDSARTVAANGELDEFTRKRLSKAINNMVTNGETNESKVEKTTSDADIMTKAFAILNKNKDKVTDNSFIGRFKNLKAKMNAARMADSLKNSTLGRNAQQGFKNMADGATSIAANLTGLDSEQIKKATADTWNTVKNHTPDMIAKGALGAVGGLFLGAPFAGALLGGAVGFIQNNETMMETLFGSKTVDKDGNEVRSGGLISKDIIDTFNKYAPSMKALGIAGGLVGLVTPFGPLGGALIGAGIGALRKNETFMDTFFGDENGIIDKKGKDFIKKAAPNMTAAAISAMFLGPFGLVGNAVLGSALGMVASTDAFQTHIFGAEDANGVRHGGLVGALKDGVIEPWKEFGKRTKDELFEWVKTDVFGPLKGAMEPIAKQLQLAITGTFKGVGMFINRFFEVITGVHLMSKIEDWILKPLNQGATKMMSAILKPVKAIASAPFKAIGAVGDVFKRRQIQTGNANYMTSAERIAFRDKHSMDKNDQYAKLDEVMATADAGQLKKISDMLDIYKSGDKSLKQTHDKAMRGLWATIDHGIGSGKFRGLREGFDREAINKHLQKGEIDSAISLINENSTDMKHSDRKELIDNVMQAHLRLQEAQKMRENFANDKAALEKTFKEETGFELSDRNVDKVSDMLNKDIYAKTKREEAKKDKDDYVGQGEKLIDESIKSQTDILVEKLDELKTSILITSKGALSAEDMESSGATIRKYIAAQKDIDMQHDINAGKISAELKHLFGDDIKLSDETLDMLDSPDNAIFNNLKALGKNGAKIKDINKFAKLDTKIQDRVARINKESGYQTEDYENLGKLDNVQFENILYALAKDGENVGNFREFADLDKDTVNAIAELRKITGLGRDKMSTRDAVNIVRSGKLAVLRRNPDAIKKIKDNASKLSLLTGQFGDDNLTKVGTGDRTIPGSKSMFEWGKDKILNGLSTSNYGLNEAAADIGEGWSRQYKTRPEGDAEKGGYFTEDNHFTKAQADAKIEEITKNKVNRKEVEESIPTYAGGNLVDGALAMVSKGEAVAKKDEVAKDSKKKKEASASSEESSTKKSNVIHAEDRFGNRVSSEAKKQSEDMNIDKLNDDQDAAKNKALKDESAKEKTAANKVEAPALDDNNPVSRAVNKMSELFKKTRLTVSTMFGVANMKESVDGSLIAADKESRQMLKQGQDMYDADLNTSSNTDKIVDILEKLKAGLFEDKNKKNKKDEDEPDILDMLKNAFGGLASLLAGAGIGKALQKLFRKGKGEGKGRGTAEEDAKKKKKGTAEEEGKAHGEGKGKKGKKKISFLSDEQRALLENKNKIKFSASEAEDLAKLSERDQKMLAEMMKAERAGLKFDASKFLSEGADATEMMKLSETEQMLREKFAPSLMQNQEMGALEKLAHDEAYANELADMYGSRNKALVEAHADDIERLLGEHPELAEHFKYQYPTWGERLVDNAIDAKHAIGDAASSAKTAVGDALSHARATVGEHLGQFANRVGESELGRLAARAAEGAAVVGGVVVAGKNAIGQAASDAATAARNSKLNAVLTGGTDELVARRAALMELTAPGSGIQKYGMNTVMQGMQVLDGGVKRAVQEAVANGMSQAEILKEFDMGLKPKAKNILNVFKEDAAARASEMKTTFMSGPGGKVVEGAKTAGRAFMAPTNAVINGAIALKDLGGSALKGAAEVDAALGKSLGMAYKAPSFIAKEILKSPAYALEGAKYWAKLPKNLVTAPMQMAEGIASHAAALESAPLKEGLEKILTNADSTKLQKAWGVTKHIAENASTKVFNMLMFPMQKIMSIASSFISKIPGVNSSKVAQGFEALTKNLATVIKKKGGGALLAKGAGKLLGPLGLMLMAKDAGEGFYDGIANPGVVLKIADQEKIGPAATTLAGICGAISGLLMGFVDPDTIADIAIDTLGPALGLGDELRSDRRIAEQQLENYNLVNNTKLTMKEFMEKTGRIKKKDMLSTFQDYAGEIANGMYEYVAELPGMIINKLKDIGQGAMNFANRVQSVTNHFERLVNKATTIMWNNPDENTLARLNQDVQINDDDPDKGIKQMMTDFANNHFFLIGTVGVVVNKVAKTVSGLVSGAAESVKIGMDTGGKIIAAAVEGRPLDWISNVMPVLNYQDGTGLSGVVGGLIAPMIGTLTSPVVACATVVRGVKEAYNTFSEAVNMISEEEGILATLAPLADSGDLMGIIDHKNPYDDKEGTAATLGSVIYTGAKAFYLIKGGIGWAMNKVGDGFKGLLEFTSGKEIDFSFYDKYEGSPFDDEYLKHSQYEFDVNHPISIIPALGETVYKYVSAIPKAVTYYIKKVFSGKGITDKIKEWKDDFFKWWDSSDKKMKETSTSAEEIKKKNASGTGLYGRGINISQLDENIKDLPYTTTGDSFKETVGQSACVPLATASAVASMGGKPDIGKALSMGVANKAPNDGTRDAFYNKYLDQYGLEAKQISPSEVASSAARGEKIIATGAARTEKDQKGTPFGPGMHAVSITGTDAKGNPVIQNPESKQSDVVYDKKTYDNINKAYAIRPKGTGLFGRGGKNMNPEEMVLMISKNTGIPPELIYAQTALESAHFQSALAKEHNYGGVKSAEGSRDKSGKYKWEVTGEDSRHHSYFASDEDFANYMSWYYPLYEEDGLLQAKTPEQWARALKHGGYYTADEGEYAAGVKSIIENNPDVMKRLRENSPNTSYNGSQPTAQSTAQSTVQAAAQKAASIFGGGKIGELLKGAFGSSQGKQLDEVYTKFFGESILGKGSGLYGRGAKPVHENIPGYNGIPDNLIKPDDSNLVIKAKLEAQKKWIDQNSAKNPKEFAIAKTTQEMANALAKVPESKKEQATKEMSKVNVRELVTTNETILKNRPKDNKDFDPLDKTSPKVDAAMEKRSYIRRFFDSFKAKFGRGSDGGRSTPEDSAAIWNYLKSKGVSNVSAAGMMGNFQAESAMYSDRLQSHDPSDGSMTAPVDGVTGYGLAQWTSEGRQQKLKDFAASQGKQDGDWKAQIDYIMSGSDEPIEGTLKAMDATNDPDKAAIIFHDRFERSADTPDKKARRGKYAQEFFQNQGNGVSDGSSNVSGAAASAAGAAAGAAAGIFGGGAIGEMLSKAFMNSPQGKQYADVYMKFFGENPFAQAAAGAAGAAGALGGAALGSAAGGNVQAAAEYAEQQVGRQGYGNNGCTTWVKEFLEKSGSPLYSDMEKAGSNPLWVPDIYNYAKDKGMLKDPSQGGATGDVVILETNRNRGDGPDHVVIATGDGQYWGNSSSRNKIVKSDIAGDYGSDNVYGYVNTGAGAGKAVSGSIQRSHAEVVADAGSTSASGTGLYAQGSGLFGRGGWDELGIDPAKLPQANTEEVVEDIAPNGQHYSKNDVDYLIKQGYTRQDAIAFLSKQSKYTTKSHTAIMPRENNQTKSETKPEKKRRGIGGWFDRVWGSVEDFFGGIFGTRTPKDKKKKTENKPTVSFMEDIAKRPTSVNGVLQPSVSTFKGGEYFNDTTKVHPVARKYISGEAKLTDVAKAIGFDKEPDRSTKLSALQQQALGFREYAPNRTWSNYLIDSELWKRSKKTSLDSWMVGKKNDVIDPKAVTNKPEQTKIGDIDLTKTDDKSKSTDPYKGHSVKGKAKLNEAQEAFRQKTLKQDFDFELKPVKEEEKKKESDKKEEAKGSGLGNDLPIYANDPKYKGIKDNLIDLDKDDFSVQKAKLQAQQQWIEAEKARLEAEDAKSEAEEIQARAAKSTLPPEEQLEARPGTKADPVTPSQPETPATEEKPAEFQGVTGDTGTQIVQLLSQILEAIGNAGGNNTNVTNNVNAGTNIFGGLGRGMANVPNGDALMQMSQSLFKIASK